MPLVSSLRVVPNSGILVPSSTTTNYVPATPGSSSVKSDLTPSVTTFNERSGAVVLTALDITEALGYEPSQGSGNSSGSDTLFTQTVSATLSAAGADQSGATPITAQFNVVTTVAAGAGVILPTTLNTKILIINRGANDLSVYPPLNAQLESYGTNVAVSIPVGNSAEFIMTSSSQGYIL